jgi:hypothetical protein
MIGAAARLEGMSWGAGFLAATFSARVACLTRSLLPPDS